MAKAKRELEELYSGIPDDSVNLTFGDLAEIRQENRVSSVPHHPLERKNSPPLVPISEASPRKEEVMPLAKLPSLDFSRALEASAQYNNINNHNFHSNHVSDHHHFMHHNNSHHNHHHHGHHREHHHNYGHGETPPHHAGGHHHHHLGMQNNSMVYDDMSQMSGAFTERGGGGRRRPGIPHSNICTLCSNYIYVFRHRCLVCGRAYCRQCVRIGMGEMSEGRKCIECLGRRFSQRYIQRAGKIGCCMGYPSLVKQQELKWAEKGPRGSGGDNRHGRSEMTMSRTISPSPRLPPTRGYNSHHSMPSFVSNTHGHGQGSFVMGSHSPYSPYFSPKNHPLPF
ncbi:OLC1v1006448C2 [Oldenlandia corymbosa var. corymbosa]|nr:OLC1v1006448C2 [Oldenlandia corymbosa var. corymbosa]